MSGRRLHGHHADPLIRQKVSIIRKISYDSQPKPCRIQTIIRKNEDFNMRKDKATLFLLPYRPKVTGYPAKIVDSNIFATMDHYAFSTI